MSMTPQAFYEAVVRERDHLWTKTIRQDARIDRLTEVLMFIATCHPTDDWQYRAQMVLRESPAPDATTGEK